MCGGGLLALGIQAVRFHADANVRAATNLVPVVVPLAQWTVVLVVWVVISLRDARAKAYP